MNVIVAHPRAGGVAQQIDAAHVRQQAAADVVNVVPLDQIAVALALVVAPAPAGRNAGVIKIVDVIVLDAVAG